MAITGLFVALIALGVFPVIAVGSLTGAPWAVMAAWVTLCVLLLIVDVSLAGSPRQVRLERDLPDRVRLDDDARSSITVTNLGRRIVHGVLRDGWQPSAGATRNRMPVQVPAGERRTVTQVLHPFRRGDRQSRSVTIRSLGPLRLGARQATLRLPGTLRVLPAFRSRKHLPSRLARLREREGRTPLLLRGPGTEFDSLREYVRGDDVRSIDWRATARRRDLVVRTWRPERDRRVVIVIDTGRTSAVRIGDEPRLDSAIEAALLLAALASRAGDHVDVLAFDRRVRARVHAASGPELLPLLVDRLSAVEPELIDTDWDAIPAQVRALTTHPALMVILTAATAPGSVRDLLAVLPQLSRTHRTLIGSVADPEVTRLVAQRSRRDEVYRAAAAQRELLDADRVADAVRRLGADVLQATPDRLPTTIADRYITLKTSGKL